MKTGDARERQRLLMLIEHLQSQGRSEREIERVLAGVRAEDRAIRARRPPRR